MQTRTSIRTWALHEETSITNESFLIGIAEDWQGEFTAMTLLQSKTFKRWSSAQKWLAKLKPAAAKLEESKPTSIYYA